MRDGAAIAEGLATQGFAVGPYGLPRALTLVGQPLEVSLRPPAPASRLHAAFSRLDEVCTFRRMPDRASLRGQARLRSCVGPTASHLFTARAIAFDDTMALDGELVRSHAVAHGHATAQWPCAKVPALPLVGPAARRSMKRSAVLRVASVVCALIPAATTPTCAVLARASRRAMIRSWSRLGTRCVAWAASREVSATLQVFSAEKVQALCPGGSASVRSTKQAWLVDVAAKHPCAEDIEAAAALRNGFAAPFLPRARR